MQLQKCLVSQNTPSVSVRDNREHTVRNLALYRHPNSLEVTELRRTCHLYDTRGRLGASADPRLHSFGIATFTYVNDLSGHRLIAHGRDNGGIISLTDTAGRSLFELSQIRLDFENDQDRSQAVIRTWEYEQPCLSGRPLRVAEQVCGGARHYTESLIYAGSERRERDANLCGKPVSHYDPAGVLKISSMSLGQVPLSVTRRLLEGLEDPAVVAHWDGEDADVWDTRLAAASYASISSVDATGALLVSTDAAGNMRRRHYDIAGRQSTCWLTRLNSPEQSVVKSMEYSADGRKLREEHASGVITIHALDPLTQRLACLQTERLNSQGGKAQTLRRLQYRYDPVGNVVSVCNATQTPRFWRNQKIVGQSFYTYDSLSQLATASGREMAGSAPASAHRHHDTDTAALTNYTRAYTYDQAGNLTQLRHDSPAAGNSFTRSMTVSDRSNRAVVSTLTNVPGEVDKLFSAGGHQLYLQPGQSLVWTPRGELHQALLVPHGDAAQEGETYRYDAGNQRVMKVTTQQVAGGIRTRRTLYLPGLELRSTSMHGSVAEELQVMSVEPSPLAPVRMLHWHRGRPAAIENDQLRYTHEDLTGSCGLETDAAGTITSFEEYYPFGGTAVWVACGEHEADYKTVRYAGKERDMTGLYYYGFRYYQSWIGRWLSADPAGTISGLNVFWALRNNPVTERDLDGRESTPSNGKTADDEPNITLTSETLILNEDQVGFHINRIGFPNILGCFAVVLERTEGLYGFHLSRKDEWQAEAFKEFIDDRSVGQTGETLGLYVVVRQDQLQASGLDRSWQDKVGRFAHVMGYSGRINEMALNPGRHVSADEGLYVEYDREAGAPSMPPSVWFKRMSKMHIAVSTSINSASLLGIKKITSSSTGSRSFELKDARYAVSVSAAIDKSKTRSISGKLHRPRRFIR